MSVRARPLTSGSCFNTSHSRSTIACGGCSKQKNNTMTPHMVWSTELPSSPLANHSATTHNHTCRKHPESTLAHLRAKHEEVMSTALELNENKTHDDPLLQRTGTHEPQNLCSQLTQAQPDIDHHILKLPQEGKLPSALLASICVAFVKVLATSQPACVCKGMLCNKSPSACMCCHTVL